MRQKDLSRWLKLILIGTGICGLVVYAFFLPSYAQSLGAMYSEFADCYWPWLLFLWATGIPCYGVLFIGWRIAVNIGRDRSFSVENAHALKMIAFLAAGDTLFFFIGNVVLLILNMSNPGVLLGALLIVFAGIAVTVAAAALSHLVLKAANLQEQSDLTI